MQESNSRVSNPTNGFSCQQTMIRIKDPALTIPFYEKYFGLKLVAKRDFP